MEAVGFAIGVVSLCVQFLDSTSSINMAMCGFIHANKVAQEYRTAVDIQRIILSDCFASLLQHFARVGVIERLERGEGSQIEEAHIDSAMQRQMKGRYAVFLEAVKLAYRLIYDISSTIDVPDYHKTDSSDPNPTFARKTQKSSLACRLCFRFRMLSSNKALERQIDKLRAQTHSIHILCTQFTSLIRGADLVFTLPSWRSSQRALRAIHQNLTNASRWDCRHIGGHDVFVKLDAKLELSNRYEPSAPDGDIVATLLFASPHKKRTDEVVGTGHESPHTRCSNTGSNSALITYSSTKFKAGELVRNLCHATHGNSGNIRQRLSISLNDKDEMEWVTGEVDVTTAPSMNKIIIPNASLNDLVGCQTGLPDVTKLSLAALISSSTLQAGDSPWLQQLWRKCDITFMAEHLDAIRDGALSLFVAQTCPNAYETPGKPIPSNGDTRQVNSSTIMLRLAIILTEIFLDKSLENELQYSPCEQLDDSVKWKIFTRLATCIEGEHRGPMAFSESIKACLQFASHSHFSLSTPKDADEFLRHVISPFQAALISPRSRLQH